MKRPVAISIKYCSILRKGEWRKHHLKDWENIYEYRFCKRRVWTCCLLKLTECSDFLGKVLLSKKFFVREVDIWEWKVFLRKMKRLKKRSRLWRKISAIGYIKVLTCWSDINMNIDGDFTEKSILTSKIYFRCHRLNKMQKKIQG